MNFFNARLKTMFTHIHTQTCVLEIISQLVISFISRIVVKLEVLTRNARDDISRIFNDKIWDFGDMI